MDQYYARFKNCPACDNPLEYHGESIDPDTGDNSVDVNDDYFCEHCNEWYEFFKTKLYST